MKPTSARKGVIVSVRMTREQFESLVARADFFGRSLTEQTRHALETDMARPLLKVNGAEAVALTLRVA